MFSPTLGEPPSWYSSNWNALSLEGICHKRRLQIYIIDRPPTPICVSQEMHLRQFIAGRFLLTSKRISIASKCYLEPTYSRTRQVPWLGLWNLAHYSAIFLCCLRGETDDWSSWATNYGEPGSRWGITCDLAGRDIVGDLIWCDDRYWEPVLMCKSLC